MLWAISAVLLQVHAVPHTALPSAGQEQVLVADASGSDEVIAYEPGRMALTPVAAAAFEPAAPAPIAPAIAPAITRSKPVFAARERNSEGKAWLTLSIAQHSAAAFDAWSTRRAITQSGAHELNPMLKPFAGNSSIYAATQVAPTLLDMLGRRMMTSRHSVLRHTWWLPQVLGTVASVSGGVNNLLVR